MKSLHQYILEGQIDGLKNVSIIRHYTTGSALKSILNKELLMQILKFEYRQM